MKNERNNYGIRNPDGMIRNRFNDAGTTYANDGRRFVRETPMRTQREVSRTAENFDVTKAPPKPTASGGSAPKTVSDYQTVADQTFAATSSTASAASGTAAASASATAAATGSATGAAAAGAATAATVATGATAAAGAIAATVATAVIVVAVFVSTLAINLTLLLTGMHSLVFRVAMTGVQDEDFETPIYASITDGGDFYQEQQVYRDTVLLTFLNLTPGTEYLVTVQNEEQIFFQKTYITADEDTERGFISAWVEDNEVFLSVEGIILDVGERFTVTAKDERGNVVFARDGVESSAEYSFKLDKPRNLLFTLLVGGQVAAVTEIRMEPEPAPEPEPEPEVEYDFDSAEWVWDDGFTSASVSFAETHGYDPLILTARVEEQIVTPVTCESDGEILYIARALWDGIEYTDEKDVTLPSTGHNYQPKWEWEKNVDGWYSEDGATLFFVCSHDETHRYQATVGTVEEDRDRYVEATCDTPARSIYVATAVWEGETYTDWKPVDWLDSVLGHDFEENDPNSMTEEELAQHITLTQNDNGEIVAATLTLHCARCDRDVTMDAAEIEVMPSAETNLCEDGGTAEYYVFWNEIGLEYAMYPYPTVEVGPIGHDYYEEPYYEWDEEEYSSATAVFSCRHGSHEKRSPMDLTHEYFAATCTESAYTLYTATVIFGGAPYTDTRRVDDDENPALEHDFPDPYEDDEDDDTDGVVIEYQYDETGAIVGATMYLTCARCGLTFSYEADEIEMTSPEPDVCNGETVEYYVFWGGDGMEVQKNPTATLVGQGHDYPDPEDVDGSNFEWSPDGDGGYTANLLLVCSRNPDHVETVPATVTEVEGAQGTVYHAEATFGGVTYSGDYS